MDWKSSSEIPEHGEVVEAIGSFKCNAVWNAEKGSWDLPAHENIQAQVVWYKSMEKDDNSESAN